MSVLRPETEAELAEILSSGGPYRICGGGTEAVIGDDAAGLSVAGLSVAGIAGIRLYEPGALTLVAAAGTPVAEIEAALAAEGQMLPFEPMDYRRLLGTTGAPTIGGVAAANRSGPRRIHSGACRDSMIGLRFVDGAGTIIRNGGRVMKNVTGYDLVKLLAGSYGTLGVVSEVAFKVLPRPEATGVCLIEGLSDHQAVAAMAVALTSPFDVSGAAHLPVGIDGAPVTMIRVEGFGESVAYRCDRLRALLGRFGDVAVETDAARTAAGWAHVRDVAAFEGCAGDIWCISVKPSDGPDLAAALRAVADVQITYDWGGGRIWVCAPTGTDLRPSLAGFAGSARLLRGAPALRPGPASPAIAAISDGLRARFDPHARLNPGTRP